MSANKNVGTPKADYKNSIWPVQPHESKKVLSLMTMMFLYCFNFTILSDLKDILVLDASDGAEPILYLKLIFVLPCSFLMMMIYTKMVSHFSKAKVFNIFMCGFIAVFLLLIILYSLQGKIERDYVVIDGVIMSWSDSLVKRGQIAFRLGPLFKLFDYWVNSLMYITAEMWGSVGISLLFWGFVNDVCSLEEAKRYYSVINAGGTLSVVIGGSFLFGYSFTMTEASKIVRTSKSEIDNTFLYILLSVAITNAILILCLYRWIVKNIDLSSVAPSKVKIKKPKLSFFDSLKFVFTSSYVMKIALMVLFFGLLTNFTDTYHKNVMSLIFLHKDQKLRFKGAESIISGIIVMVLCTFVAGNAIRKLGWTWTALLCPMILALFGTAFLTIQVVFKRDFAQMFDRNQMKIFRQQGFISHEFNSKLVLPVYILGIGTVVLAKALRYSMFDPSKEMAYIPLDKDVRSKAKAAVDVVGARFGKSGSAAIQVAYMLGSGSAIASDYVETVFGMFVCGIIIWIYSIISLGKSFNKLTSEMDEEFKIGKIELEDIATIKTEDTGMKTEYTSMKTEDTSMKTEDTSKKTEVTSKKTEDTSMKTQDVEK